MKLVHRPSPVKHVFISRFPAPGFSVKNVSRWTPYFTPGDSPRRVERPVPRHKIVGYTAAPSKAAIRERGRQLGAQARSLAALGESVKRLASLATVAAAIVLMLVFVAPAAAGEVDAKFLDCLWAKEASRQLNPPDGDNFRAIGPFQIWKSYWQDAVEFDKTIGGSYEDCRDKNYAEKVVKAYMRRYTPKNANYEHMARVHNGGPRGHLKDSTRKYWASRAFDPLR